MKKVISFVCVFLVVITSLFAAVEPQLGTNALDGKSLGAGIAAKTNVKLKVSADQLSGYAIGFAKSDISTALTNAPDAIKGGITDELQDITLTYHTEKAVADLNQTIGEGPEKLTPVYLFYKIRSTSGVTLTLTANQLHNSNNGKDIDYTVTVDTVKGSTTGGSAPFSSPSFKASNLSGITRTITMTAEEPFAAGTHKISAITTDPIDASYANSNDYVGAIILTVSTAG